MNKFQRERRYLVLKLKDVHHLSDEHKYQLEAICQSLQVIRADRGAGEMACVVVENDWPEYEYVWGLIKHRMEMQP